MNESSSHWPPSATLLDRVHRLSARVDVFCLRVRRYVRRKSLTVVAPILIMSLVQRVWECKALPFMRAVVGWFFYWAATKAYTQLAPLVNRYFSGKPYRPAAAFVVPTLIASPLLWIWGAGSITLVSCIEAWLLFTLSINVHVQLGRSLESLPSEDTLPGGIPPRSREGFFNS